MYNNKTLAVYDLNQEFRVDYLVVLGMVAHSPDD